MTLLLIGAGGHGRAVADLASVNGTTVVFADDSWPVRTSAGDWPIIGDLDAVQDHNGPICITVGDNRARAELHDRFSHLPLSPALVHRSAIVSSGASLGHGTVVMAGAVLNFGAQIGVSTILNTGAIVDHDCALGDHCHVSPGAVLTGGVRVGDRSWIGAGAVIRDKVQIGRGAIVGAGAVVLRDVPDGARVGGVPARNLR